MCVEQEHPENQKEHMRSSKEDYPERYAFYFRGGQDSDAVTVFDPLQTLADTSRFSEQMPSVGSVVPPPPPPPALPPPWINDVPTVRTYTKRRKLVVFSILIALLLVMLSLVVVEQIIGEHAVPKDEQSSYPLYPLTNDASLMQCNGICQLGPDGDGYHIQEQNGPSVAYYKPASMSKTSSYTVEFDFKLIQRDPQQAVDLSQVWAGFGFGPPAQPGVADALLISPDGHCQYWHYQGQNVNVPSADDFLVAHNWHFALDQPVHMKITIFNGHLAVEANGQKIAAPQKPDQKDETFPLVQPQGNIGLVAGGGNVEGVFTNLVITRLLP